MKIAICGLVKSANLGEEIIAKSLCWIISDTMKSRGLKDPEFVFVDIQATKDNTFSCRNLLESRLKNLYGYKLSGIPAELLYFCLKKAAMACGNSEIKNAILKIRHFIWLNSINLGKRHWKYFSNKFLNVDLIVIDGAGLLEYSYNAYQETLGMITRYADEFKIPVVFNAIGKAGEFDKKDYRCRILMNAFRRDCVEYISARDSREIVQECAGDKINVELLADAAFCSGHAFHINKDENSEFIGIGLIRGNAFLSYQKGALMEKDVIALFVGIAKVLDRKKIRYKFFTNGAYEDYQLGLKVVACLGADSSILIHRPVSAEKLMETIGKFSCLITCRMHSSIAAFALGIPSVVLSWNNKINQYMQHIGYPDRVITGKELIPELIVDRMLDAMKQGIDLEKRERMMRLAMESVQGYAELLEKLSSAKDE